MKGLFRRLFSGLFGKKRGPSVHKSTSSLQLLGDKFRGLQVSHRLPRTVSISTCASFSTAVSIRTALDPVLVKENVYAETESGVGYFESNASSIFSLSKHVDSDHESDTQATDYTSPTVASKTHEEPSMPQFDICAWGLPCTLSAITFTTAPVHIFEPERPPIKTSKATKNFLTVIYMLLILTKDQRIQWDDRELWGWLCRGYANTMSRKLSRAYVSEKQQESLFEDIPCWGF